MKVTLEQAYAEACRVIGEQIVTQRLIEQRGHDNSEEARETQAQA